MPAGVRLVTVAEAPREAKRLLIEWAGSRSGIEAMMSQADIERTLSEVFEGRFVGALLFGPQDDAVALARWYEESLIGRRAWVYVAEGFRSSATLGTLVDLARGEAPLLTVIDDGLRMPYAALATTLHPRGYYRLSRLDMYYPADRPIPRVGALAKGVSIRPLTQAHRDALVDLLIDTYSDNRIEEAIFSRDRDRRSDARQAIEDLTGTRFGRWMSEASFGVFAGGDLAGATLVNSHFGTLITEVMVAPRYRRRGFARAVLRATLEAIRTASTEPPRLVVTRTNHGALSLYTSLGFVPRPGAEGGLWLDLATFGLDRPDEDDTPVRPAS